VWTKVERRTADETLDEKLRASASFNRISKSPTGIAGELVPMNPTNVMPRSEATWASSLSTSLKAVSSSNGWITTPGYAGLVMTNRVFIMTTHRMFR
jgi:hypothetical protein